MKPRKRPVRQLTQRQVLQQMLKLVQPARPARSSIKLSRGPRGQVLIEVLVHAGDEPGLGTLAQVEARATEVYDRLTAQYPLDGNGGGGE